MNWQLQSLECRRLLAYANAIADINATTDMLSPTKFTVVGAYAYFSGVPIDGGGPELFRTDGTRDGTVLVKDILPGWAGSEPNSLTDVNGTLFFSAKDDTGGIELWKSDGTAEGTVRVKDIRPGTADSSPANLTAVGTQIFFSASDGNGAKLWVSNGTPEGTFSLGAGDPINFAAYNGLCLFSTPFGTSRELWRSDGTLAGTVRVPSGSLNPRQLTQFNGLIYYCADPTSTSRGDLYRTDGYSSTRVKQINLDANDYTALYRFVPSGDRLYFIANNQLSGAYELWRSDGTDAGTFKLVALSGANQYLPMVAGQSHSILFNNSSAATGKELWVSNGEISGTQLLIDLVPGTTSGTPNVALVSLGSDVLFAPNREDGSNELWRTNLTSPGTAKLMQVEGPGLAMFYLTMYGSTVLFNGLRWIGQGDMYRTDGTASGTWRIGASPASVGTASSMLDYLSGPAFGRVGETMYFSASDGIHGHELWRTEPGSSPGTLGGASLVADLWPAGMDSFPNGFATSADGSLYFYADSPAGRELYRIAPGATSPQIIEVAPGTTSSSAGGIAVFGNTVYFRAVGAGDSYSALWRYVPGQAPTKMLGPSGYPQNPSVPVKMGSFYYFSANNSSSGTELYRIDDSTTTATLVADIYSSYSSSYPTSLTALGDTLYFVATDPTGGTELWKSQGTAATTQRVKNIAAGTASAAFGELYVHNQMLYFSAAADGTNNTLWRSDGTDPGTVEISTLALPQQFRSIGDALYFVAGDAQGRAVFRLDAPPSGGTLPPIRLTPTTTGAFPLVPNALYPVGTTLYFTATAGTGKGDHVELWSTDGIPMSPETKKLRDLQPIAPSTQTVQIGSYWYYGRNALANNSSYLFFPAYRPDSGNEPFALPLIDPGGGVRGRLYTDLNRNNAFDPGEPLLAGHTVFVDFDSDKRADADEPTAVTDATGNYFISSLDVGTYFIRSTVAAGGLSPSRQITIGRTVATGIDLGLVDNEAPSVLWGDTDPSRPGRVIRVRFNEDVFSTLDPGDLRLEDLGTGELVVPTWVGEVNTSTNEASFCMPDLPGGTLRDGNWRGTISAYSVKDRFGNPNDRDFTFDFFVLTADANRDRVVNFFDLTTLAANYGASGKGWADGDFNGDGTVNFFDLTALAANYSVTLPAPSEPVADAPVSASAQTLASASSEVTAVESVAAVEADLGVPAADQTGPVATPVAAPQAVLVPGGVGGGAGAAHKAKTVAVSDPPQPSMSSDVRAIDPGRTGSAALPPSPFVVKARKRPQGKGIFADAPHRTSLWG